MRLVVLIGFLASVLVLSCKDQPTPDPISKGLNADRAKEDLALFRQILEAAHPSLYDYYTPKKSAQMFDSISNTINDGNTTRDFMNKLRYIVNEIRCSHTSLYLPSHVIDTLYNRELFFPLPLLLVEKKLLVNSDHDLPHGTEIISVNGTPVIQLLDSLMYLSTIDGAHRDVQRHLAAVNFGYYYYLKYGGFRKFDVELRDTFNVKKNIVVEAIDLALYNTRAEQSYYYDVTDVDYALDVHEKSGYAILRVAAFDMPSTNQRLAYEHFLENSFELLRLKPKVKNLIIDIRENTGGKLYYCFLLYSYLAKENFREYTAVTSRMKSVPLTFHCNDTRDDIKYINDEIDEKFSSAGPNKYQIIDSLIQKWEPNELRFSGNVYVLTNPAVTSSASCFASLVQSSGRGKIVGTETAGGYSHGNGFATLSYTLPYSEMELSFSYAKLFYYYQQKKSSRGVIPDYQVPDTYESFRDNKDKQLLFVVDSLIKRK